LALYESYHPETTIDSIEQPGTGTALSTVNSSTLAWNPYLQPFIELGGAQSSFVDQPPSTPIALTSAPTMSIDTTSIAAVLSSSTSTTSTPAPTSGADSGSTVDLSTYLSLEVCATVQNLLSSIFSQFQSLQQQPAVQQQNIGSTGFGAGFVTQPPSLRPSASATGLFTPGSDHQFVW